MNARFQEESFSDLIAEGRRYAQSFDIRRAFQTQPQRFGQFSLAAPYVRADLSKNLWDLEVLHGLTKIAESAGLEAQRAALVAGDVVNLTEGKPALHAWLRIQASQGSLKHGAPEWLKGLDDMLVVAESIRARPVITDVVHIGIGGSGIGPELVLQALQPYQSGGRRFHFVANVDGHDLHATLQSLSPQNTFFVVASKSWSTAETLRNAQSALDWFHARGGTDIRQHFVAVTSRPDKAYAMGIQQTLDIPEGVGGRFSIWSAVGLPVAVALGTAGLKSLHQGAADMDAHFLHAPVGANLPVWLGLLDVWNCTFLQLSSRCVVPYHHGLRRLPAYLQQLEMESNGKRVRTDGSLLDYPTVTAVWGEEGTNSQHAFFQWLHQGTQRICTEFVLVRQPTHPLPGHHDHLLANALAQAQALMVGATARVDQRPGHQDFPGNRPSTVLMLETLSPASLGALLALYEHRAFVAAVVWGINPFDQWGVELGKTLAEDLMVRMKSGDRSNLDGSTAGLLNWCCSDRTSP